MFPAYNLTPGSSLSVVNLLKCCKSIAQTQQIHARIVRKGLEQDHFITSHLLSLASDCIGYSLFIFQRIHFPSTVLYNILFKTYSGTATHFRQAISLFVRMKGSSNAAPDKYTFPSLIKMCCNSKKEGEYFHASAIRHGVIDDIYVGSSLVGFYAKLMEVGPARRVFDEMANKNVITWTSMIVGYVNVGDLENATILCEKMPEKNVVTWNAMMGGLVKEGMLDDARKLFDEMPSRDTVSFTVMIDGYAKSGDMSSARALFEEAKEKDVVTWTALINGYVNNAQPDEAIEIFRRMESLGIKPDNYLITSVLSAFSKVGNLEVAKWLESYLKRSSIDTSQPYVISALIDMHAKCGNLEKAKALFDSLPAHDMVVYCSMIQGYSLHGKTDIALSLFDRMVDEGLVPDEVAFMVILMACSRGGLVDEGWKYFNMLRNRYSIVPTPSHYICIVELLCREGRLKETYELLNHLPVESHVPAWGALLGACKLFDDITLGEVVANKLIEAQPECADRYVLLSNIYAASDRWLDVHSLRGKMKEQGILKPPGCSWSLNNLFG